MLGNLSNLRPRRPLGIAIATAASLAVVLLVATIAYLALPSVDTPMTEARYNLASNDGSDAINPFEITVIDGDTIKARGRTISLVGFDAPETGSRARCPRERELGDRATAQLKTLVAGGGLELRMIQCACNPGTEGTPDCNNGRACGELRSYGRPIGGIMIQYVLARPYVCEANPCQPRKSWC